ncbi:hypothetical protein MVEN_01141400 [Mycena venus]|uniref:Uncharacterized protein n=1 Tax=Mycena venus TaxID=2733690 RepID=A0A8H7CVG9_9AGAR|nr:hypothetical protein MVEN_01141400 [Mycena venus]
MSTTVTMAPEKEKNEERIGRRWRRERWDSTRSSGEERERDGKHDREKGKHRARDRERDRDREKRKSRDRDHEQDESRRRERKDKHSHHAEFDVVSGADADRFTRRFVRDRAVSDGALHTRPSHPRPRRTSITDPSTNPAVDHDSKLKCTFALPCATGTGLNAGRRVIDFYMNWRGKEKTHPLKGRARRATFLDAEFRRVREALDGEWGRVSRALKGTFGAGDDEMEKPGTRSGMVVLGRAPTDPQPLPRLPPVLAQYAREERDKNGGGGPIAPPFPRSVSDPLPLPSSFPLNTEGMHRGSMESLPSVTSLPLLGMIRGVPVGNRVPLRVTNPGDTMSISSSSGSLAEVPTAKFMKSSPLRDGVAFVAPPSDTAQGNANAPMPHTSQLPGRTVSDSNGSSKSRQNKSTGSRKEKTSRAKDSDKILIVPLDKHNKVALSDDDVTWHGLERRLSTRSARRYSLLDSVHDSPWLGPLVNLDEDMTYTPDHSDYYHYFDSESDSNDDDNDEADRPPQGVGPAMPIKSLLPAGRYLSPEVAIFGVAPSPCPALHMSPPVQSSPYHQLPRRRPGTPAGYGNGTTPLRLSSGAVYPPTAYMNPNPAPYASSYPPASLHPPACFGYTANFY